MPQILRPYLEQVQQAIREEETETAATEETDNEVMRR